LGIEEPNWERTETEKGRATGIVVRAAVVIVSSETKDSSAGAVFFVLFAAAVSAVVALAVFGPVAHD